MYPSEELHDLYIREKQLMLSGTAMWLAKQAADKASGREVQDEMIDHLMNVHHADQLLQQFIDYRLFANRKLNEVMLANAQLRINNEEMILEIERLQRIIEDNWTTKSFKMHRTNWCSSSLGLNSRGYPTTSTTKCQSLK